MASIATWSALANRMSFSWTRMARGPGPSPANVPSMDREHAGVYVLLDLQQVHYRFVNNRMSPVTLAAQQSAKGVFSSRR